MTHRGGVTSFSAGASLRVRTEQTGAHRTVFNTDARASRAHSRIASLPPLRCVCVWGKVGKLQSARCKDAKGWRKWMRQWRHGDKRLPGRWGAGAWKKIPPDNTTCVKFQSNQWRLTTLFRYMKVGPIYIAGGNQRKVKISIWIYIKL